MDDLVFFGIIGLVGVGLGFGLSALFNSLRDPSAGQGVQDKESIELLELRRHKRSGQLQVHIRGKKIPGFRALSGSAQETMRKIMLELQAWVGESAVSQVQPAATHMPETPPAPPVEEEPPLAPPPSRLSSRLPAQPSRAAQPEEVRPPSMNIRDIVSRAVSSNPREKPAAPLTIVGQIDEILQEWLSDPMYAHLAARGVRLLDHPTKGMVVRVGMEQYDDVESVPDNEIRRMIRACVKDWENRTET